MAIGLTRAMRNARMAERVVWVLYAQLVIGTGPGNPPAVRVSTGNTVLSKILTRCCLVGQTLIHTRQPAGGAGLV